MSVLHYYRKSVLNAVSIHVALHRLECALCVELHRLKTAVLISVLRLGKCASNCGAPAMRSGLGISLCFTPLQSL